MLQSTGAARTVLSWLTLFFTWSAFLLWQHGGTLMQVIMTQSNLFAYDLARRMAGDGMMPPGVITVLVILLVLAGGSLLASASLLAVSLLSRLLFILAYALRSLAGARPVLFRR